MQLEFIKQTDVLQLVEYEIQTINWTPTVLPMVIVHWTITNQQNSEKKTIFLEQVGRAHAAKLEKQIKVDNREVPRAFASS